MCAVFLFLLLIVGLNFYLIFNSFRGIIKPEIKLYKPIQYINTQLFTPELTYMELPPSSHLSDFISCYWIVETKTGGADAISHRILPDGCIDIIFDFIGESAFICGVTDKTDNMTLNGKFRYFGIRFLPRAISYILKSDTAGSLNVRVDIDSVSGSFSQMSEAVLGKNNLPECIRIIESHMSSMFKNYSINEKFNLLLNHALDCNGNITVQELSDYHSISEKQIGRYFLNNTGLSTKSFLKILRFQNAYQNLAVHKHCGTSLALDTGYYDQSHLIKDMKHFLGDIKNIY